MYAAAVVVGIVGGCRVPFVFGMLVGFRVGLAACCCGCSMLGIDMVPLAVAGV